MTQIDGPACCEVSGLIEHKHDCTICSLWNVKRDATILSSWEDGTRLFLCNNCHFAGAGTSGSVSLV